ncbi:apoptosis-associated speck-like protein containing a CARD isoform X2 [Ctenopharyngodon idella]|uniref:apoptosis-associated speck-like protein containing a CARD isoform X2 n=1 Tax=Ctenopharyngodon idella TaxID=7959 RepID=UPI00222ED4F7|nr:apoptosis-associated speck-like protein containing a CARD isoform X2 [Ctenopharyngodon idella]
MPKTIKDHLENTFEDLGEGNLKKFKIKLRDRKEEPRIRQATIEKVKDALDLADLMVNTFTLNGAGPVTLEILEVINCHELAAELRENIGDAPVVPGPGPGAPSTEHFIDKNRTELIARVNNVDAILDELHQKKVISFEDYSNIRAEKTKPNKMRELLMGPINSAGTRGKDALYQALKKSDPLLVEDLESQRK